MEDYSEQKYFRGLSPNSIPHIVIVDTVKEILSIAKKKLHKPFYQLSVLDVGSGWGEYSFELEKYVHNVSAVEPWDTLYKTARINKKKIKSNVKFYNTRIENFKTKESFDLAISLTTVEHMMDAESAFRKVLQLLKPGGMLYLTAPNKLWPYEQHYGLFFLNWLPLPLANVYMKIMGKGNSFQDSSYARTYYGMKKLFDAFDCTYVFHVPQNEQAAYLGIGKTDPVFKIMKTVGIWLIKRFPIFWVISKGFIMVIIKNK